MSIALERLPGPGVVFVRLPAVLLLRVGLCRRHHPGVAAGLLRDAPTRHGVRAAGLACSRDAVRIYRRRRRRLPADGGAELDRKAAAAGQAARLAVLDLGCGTNCRQRFGVDRLGPGRGDRFAVPDLACGRSRARDHCRQEVGQSPDRRHCQPAGRRKPRVSPGGASHGSGGIRNPWRCRHGDRPDRADRRAHHSELYPQLAGAAGAGSYAIAVRPLRCRDDGFYRARACALGGTTAGPDHRRAAAGMRLDAHRSPGALDRLPHVRGPAGADPACRLCIHPGRFHPLRALGARPDCAERRDPRLDGWRDRHHDARRDEPGNARSHRAAAGGVHGDASDLCIGHRRCSGEGLRGAGSRSYAARCWLLPALPGLRHFSDLPPPIRWRSGRRAGSDV